MQEVVILELEFKPFLYVRSPPAVLVARLDSSEPAAKRVEQQGDCNPDQVDGGEAEPPPGRESIERCQEWFDVPVHGNDESDYQSVYDVQVKEVEEERHASKNNKQAR